jgi:hypothetical protein
MKKVILAVFAFVFPASALAQSVPVTVDNFTRAESDLYMGNTVKDGGFAKFHHNRTPTEIDRQFVSA